MTALTGLNLETAEDFQVIPSLLVSFTCFLSLFFWRGYWTERVVTKLLLKDAEKGEAGGGGGELNWEEAYYKDYGIKKLNDKINDHLYMK